MKIEKILNEIDNNLKALFKYLMMMDSYTVIVFIVLVYLSNVQIRA